MADMYQFARPRRAFVYREKSDRTGNLMEAFAKASSEFLPVERDTKAEWGWFASLRSMKRATSAALGDHQIAVWHEVSEIEGRLYLIAVMGHGPSDEWVSSVFPLRQTGDTDQDLAYLTKMRRVSYATLLCLAQEDEPEVNEIPGATRDADYMVKALAWAEQHRLAGDAIAVATSVRRLDEIIARIHAKASAGEMDPAIVSDLTTAAERRKKKIAADVAMAAKPDKVGPAPQPKEASK